MELAPGHRLGPYEILGTLGSGGMGTVYRARDTRLQREVAIKVALGQFGERFEREARVIAQLNHPNICTLFDVGPDYLVMELVEGETLAQRVKRGAIPADEVVRIGQQISEALDVAHDRAVVHRDLKPGNVMIRPDGRVKVLDFGLAKVGGGAATATAANENSPTITMDETQAGVILGTASYMSPEQAMGQPSDKRSDVYSFGAVVYEMVTGERLHKGTATTEVLASVIKDEPKWDKVPARFRRLLRSCLAKDPQQRLRHIGDVMRLVEDGATTDPISVSSLPPMPPQKKNVWLWPTLALILLAALLAAWWKYGRGPAKLEVVRFQILENGQFKLENASPAVSPDGKWVAWQAPGPDGMSHIWLRALDSLDTRMIPGTESPNLLQSPPFWSYDSKTIAFSINPAPFAPGFLKRVDIAGGTPQTVCETSAGVAGLAWSRDGTIVFIDPSKRILQRVAATGGQVVPVTEAVGADLYHLWPQFLPDQKTFLYFRVTRGGGGGIFVGSIDKTPAEQSMKPILVTDRQAFYSPAGGDHLVFLRDRTLFAQPFDVATQTLTGQPVAVVDGVSSFALANSGRYSVSENGVLAYNAGPQSSGNIVLTERATGKVMSVLSDWDGAPGARLSPDGKRAAIARADRTSGTTNVWITDLATGSSNKITYGAGRNDFPIWSPDGSQILFASNRQGIMDLYVKNADGSGDERLVLKSDRDKVATNWGANGYALFVSDNDIFALPRPESGSSQPAPLIKTNALEGQAFFSPDGKWLMYTSAETGRQEIYVRPFDTQHLQESGTSNRWMVSRGGGAWGQWAKEGSEILYFSNGRVVSQAVDPAKPYELKGPVDNVSEATTSGYTVSQDGTKLIRVVVPPGDAPGQLVIVKNWHAILQK